MFKPKQPQTLKQYLVGSLVKTTLMFVMFMTSFLTVSALAQKNVEMEFVTPPETPAITVAGSVGDLIAKHDCWTGEAPADMEGKMPGHVVVTKDGAFSPTYGGSRLVGKALEQIFEGKNYNLTVHGFCR